MAASQDRMDAILNDLKQQRDELKLKMHLAKADARDEWERMEERWSALNHRASVKKDQLDDVMDDATDNVEAALELAAEELKKGYKRLRKLF